MAVSSAAFLFRSKASLKAFFASSYTAITVVFKDQINNLIKIDHMIPRVEGKKDPGFSLGVFVGDGFIINMWCMLVYVIIHCDLLLVQVKDSSFSSWKYIGILHFRIAKDAVSYSLVLLFYTKGL